MAKKKAVKTKKKAARRPKSAQDRPGRNPKLTESQEAFLAAYEQYGKIYPAMKAVGLGARQNHYNWLKNEKYARLFSEAEENAVELAESELRRRALGANTREKQHYYKGQLVGTETWRKYDTVALIFYLKSKRPEVYRDRYDVTSGGRPLIDFEGLRQLRDNYRQNKDSKALPDNGRKRANERISGNGDQA